ncbi:MAG: DUF1768 domain-containing protein, partial [Alphaproteobacteria bacterium]|nr:DUF1768 domain-containing protein [Alphaproteobacteria bacterium]
AGVSVTHVAAKRYEGSGFTQAALRGAKYVGANGVDEMATAVSAALKPQPSFVYTYLNTLDSAGHSDGVGSDKWLTALQQVSEFITKVKQLAPAGTRIWVTSDHGMVNSTEQIILGQDNKLLENVTLIGGEPRARHIYIKEGAIAETITQWHSYPEIGRKLETGHPNNPVPIYQYDVTSNILQDAGRNFLFFYDPTIPPYGMYSNFYKHPFTMFGIRVFYTSEHLFQCIKVLFLRRVTTQAEFNRIMDEYLGQAGTDGDGAKRAARKMTEGCKWDTEWDTESINVMFLTLMAKFLIIPQAYNQIVTDIRSNEFYFVEHVSRDGFCGSGNTMDYTNSKKIVWQNRNYLGKLLTYMGFIFKDR